MSTQQQHIGELADNFARQLCRQRLPGKPRTIGREAEFPVIWSDGTAGDVPLLLQEILSSDEKATFKPIYEDLIGFDSPQLTGLESPSVILTQEVGKGTIEVITGPCGDLHTLRKQHESAMKVAVSAASNLGLLLLGCGVQPVTPPSRDLMTGRPRYLLLADQIKEPWLAFTVCASDQTHVDVYEDETIAVLNITNLFTPLITGLCSNSVFYEGQVGAHCSARHAWMGAVTPRARYGIPPAPFIDMEHVTTSLCDLPVLLDQVSAGKFLAGNGASFLSRLPSWTTSEARWEAFISHEHYVWHSSRLRSKQGTVELRSACQQPWESHMAATALSLAIVEARPELEEWVEKKLGGLDNAWPIFRQWQDDLAEHGLRQTAGGEGAWPTLKDMEELLRLCELGLKRRGLGEDSYLKPLQRRLEAVESPAQHVARLCRGPGQDPLKVLLEAYTIKPLR